MFWLSVVVWLDYCAISGYLRTLCMAFKVFFVSSFSWPTVVLIKIGPIRYCTCYIFTQIHPLCPVNSGCNCVRSVTWDLQHVVKVTLVPLDVIWIWTRDPLQSYSPQHLKQWLNIINVLHLAHRFQNWQIKFLCWKPKKALPATVAGSGGKESSFQTLVTLFYPEPSQSKATVYA